MSEREGEEEMFIVGILLLLYQNMEEFNLICLMFMSPIILIVYVF